MCSLSQEKVCFREDGVIGGNGLILETLERPSASRITFSLLLNGVKCWTHGGKLPKE